MNHTEHSKKHQSAHFNWRSGMDSVKGPHTITTSASGFFNNLTVSNSVTHKDYIKNLLLNKFHKKFGNPSKTDFQTSQVINNEVLKFVKNEKLNKDNLKDLEQRIQSQLDKKAQAGQLKIRQGSYDMFPTSTLHKVTMGQSYSKPLLPTIKQSSDHNLLQLHVNQQ